MSMDARRERLIVENFVATISGDMTLDEAMLNADLDARAHGMSREGTRALGAAVRMRFARRGG